jgi:Holliday junction resolvase-like predicted endonuclease
MSIERNLAISILKLTKEGPILIESINKEAKLPAIVCKKLLEKLQNEDLIYFKNDAITVDSTSRIKLAVKAVSLGADVEHISDLLCWQEFEEIAAIALKNNDYLVQRNFRFKHGPKRLEIDIVGCKKPIVLCIDCKHWQRAISPSALKKIVDLQTQRAQALADSLPIINKKLDCINWEKTKFIPTVLSLIPSAYKFYQKVPIVPILQLQDFLYQLPAYTEMLKFFPKKFKTLSHDFED